MSSVIKVDAIQNQSGTSSLNVNSDGVIRHGKIPMLKVGIGAVNSPSGTSSKVAYNSLSSSHVFDGEDNMSAFNTSTSTYTIPANCAGLWHISVSLYSSGAVPNQFAVYLNGNRKEAIGNHNGVAPMMHGALVRRFSVGDEIQIWTFHGSGTVNQQPNVYHSWWQMYFLG